MEPIGYRLTGQRDSADETDHLSKLTVDDIRRAIEEYGKRRDSDQLLYVATPTEYNNPIWRDWFIRNFPNANLVCQKQLPTEPERCSCCGGDPAIQLLEAHRGLMRR